MSRRLFYLLLAANLIVWLWEVSGRHRPYRDTMPEQDTLERLVLLGEAPGTPVPPDKVVEPSSTISTDSNVREPAKAAGILPDGDRCCRCVGPFETMAEAGFFAHQLHQLGIDVEIQTSMDAFPVAYWLMYPAAGDPARARENLRRLRALGFTDLWLFERGPWRGAISLGLYAQLSRAEAVAGQLRTQSVEVTVLPRYREITLFWVRLRSEPFPGWLAGLHAGLEGRDCRHLEVSAVSIPSAGKDGAAVSPRL